MFMLQTIRIHGRKVLYVLADAMAVIAELTAHEKLNKLQKQADQQQQQAQSTMLTRTLLTANTPQTKPDPSQSSPSARLARAHTITDEDWDLYANAQGGKKNKHSRKPKHKQAGEPGYRPNKHSPRAGGGMNPTYSFRSVGSDVDDVLDSDRDDVDEDGDIDNDNYDRDDDDDEIDIDDVVLVAQPPVQMETQTQTSTHTNTQANAGAGVGVGVGSNMHKYRTLESVDEIDVDAEYKQLTKTYSTISVQTLNKQTKLNRTLSRTLSKHTSFYEGTTSHATANTHTNAHNNNASTMSLFAGVGVSVGNTNSNAHTTANAGLMSPLSPESQLAAIKRLLRYTDKFFDVIHAEIDAFTHINPFTNKQTHVRKTRDTFAVLVTEADIQETLHAHGMWDTELAAMCSHSFDEYEFMETIEECVQVVSKHFGNAMNLYRLLFGDLSLRAADLMFELGEVYRCVCLYTDSKACYEAAVIVYKQRFESAPNHRMGHTLYALAECLLVLEPKRETLCKRLMEEALSIFIQVCICSWLLGYLCGKWKPYCLVSAIYYVGWYFPSDYPC
jgi:hypothetical protein